MRLPQTSNAWMFAMFKNFIHSQLLKSIFFSPNRCETQITKNYQTSEEFFYRSVISTFAKNYFYYCLVLIAQHKISVLATSVTSSNLRNQASLFQELRLLQFTDLLCKNIIVASKMHSLEPGKCEILQSIKQYYVFHIVY